MKSPAPLLATGFCFGVRWQSCEPLRVQTASKDCTSSDAARALKPLSCWFFVWYFFNNIFFSFFEMAWLGPLIVINLFFCKGRSVSHFSWSVCYWSSLPAWSWGPSPSQALPYSVPTFRTAPRVALRSISHWINCYEAISLDATVCCSCFPAPTSAPRLIQPAVCLLQSGLPTAAAHKLL